MEREEEEEKKDNLSSISTGFKIEFCFPSIFYTRFNATAEVRGGWATYFARAKLFQAEARRNET